MRTLYPAAARRAFLQASAGVALGGTALTGCTFASKLPVVGARSGDPTHRLVLAPTMASLVGADHPSTRVWAYNGTIPGPMVRARQGEPVRILVENRLEEDTTVHWHGIRLPLAMDGVPGLSQPPIPPGGRFVYAFTPPDAGTFWYHPHANSLRQLGMGLAGAMIVEERSPVIGYDRDLTWVLGDWRLTPDAQVDDRFGSPREAAMVGRIGNTVTLNGRVPQAEAVRAGERIRLRLVNVSLARIMALRFEGHAPVVIAVDGQPCVPHPAPEGRVVLGPAMRVDLALDLVAEPGTRHRVIDAFIERRAYRLVELAYLPDAPIQRPPLGPVAALPPNPLPEPDLARAERILVSIQGGMHGGLRMAAPDRIWALNGHSMGGDGHAGMAPMRTLRLGGSYVLRFLNETAFHHPMHVHGFSFLQLARDGEPVPHRQWADTVMVGPRETVDVAFVADTPGDWMLHCHVTDHQVSGLMAVLRVA